MLKAVILIGGPLKGTRFRPLSLDIPKPLFPVGGIPIIQHHIEACINIKEIKEILLIGFYPLSQIQQFINDLQHKYTNIIIKYLQEFSALGTAGGMYHFRDQIRFGNPKAFFVMNGDVCGDFPLEQLYKFYISLPEHLVTVLGTEATKHQSLSYGCMVTNKETGEVTHYVEKPSSYVSTLINCGIYVFSLDIFKIMGDCYGNKNCNNNKEPGYIQLEQEVLSPLAGSGNIYALQSKNWWAQLKTASSAIYANRHYLQLYQTIHPERLIFDKNNICTIYNDVHIDQSVIIHPTAVIGPNVSIGSGVIIGPGVRIKETIILSDAIIDDRTLILYSIIGRGSKIGKWSRIEGTPSDPDPNKPFAKMENLSLFNNDGRLNPSITILGCSVTVKSETVILNSIVLPNKEITKNIKNEIIL